MQEILPVAQLGARAQSSSSSAVEGGKDEDEDKSNSARTFSATTAKILDEKIVGFRIQVRYVDDGEEKWYDGIVVDYRFGRHEIVFQDGMQVELNLAEETIRIEQEGE